MIARRLRLCVLATTVASATLVQAGRVQAASTTWPALTGNAGAESVRWPSEVDSATALGLTLTYLPYTDPQSPLGSEMRTRGMRYLDGFLWDEVVAACGTSFGQCSLTPDQEVRLESAVTQHLAAVHDDASIVGFPILDDYPGPIQPTLAALHSLVQQSNATSATVRPTICPLAAALDHRDPGTGQLTADDTAFDRAVSNYSPAWCDLPAIYSYGSTTAGQSAASIDWSMSRLLPHVRQGLLQRGWTPAMGFIGMPQAFTYPGTGGWATPAGGDLQTQTTAFCVGGATAMLAYAWDDFATPAAKAVELFNSPDLQSGYARGVAACRPLWSGSAPPGSSTTAPPPGSSTTPPAPGLGQLIQHLYADLLGRPADDRGAAFFASQMSGGASSRTIARELMASDEFIARTVASCFRQFLHRSPDDVGATAFAGALARGATTVDVEVGIASAPEYVGVGSANQTFITSLFTDMLGRDPDPAGMAYFTQRLQAGVPATAIVRTIATSPERDTDLVGDLYLSYLHRNADAAGLAAFAAAMMGGMSREAVIADLVGSREYALASSST